MDLFQSDIYLSFLESVENLTPFKFSLYRDDSEVGRIQGYTQKDGNVIMSFLSRRAIINGGPFLADDITADEVRSLLEKCVTGLKTLYILDPGISGIIHLTGLFLKMPDSGMNLITILLSVQRIKTLWNPKLERVESAT